MKTKYTGAKYCRDCGKALVFTNAEYYQLEYYDEKTGEKIIEKQFNCPSYEGFSDAHDAHGREYITYERP